MRRGSVSSITAVAVGVENGVHGDMSSQIQVVFRSR